MKLLKANPTRMIRLVACLAQLLYSTGLRGALLKAPSPSYSDVSGAVARASAGDIVSMPAGAAVWTNVLKLTTGITLLGAGTNSTFITNQIPTATPWASYQKPPLIWIQITNDTPVRITGFYFFCNWTNGGQGIVCDPINLPGYPIIHSYRVDHCVFERAKSRSMELLGAVYGVVDHCTFRNCELITEPTAGNDIEWKRFTAPYYGLGTTNSIVIEDCTFLVDSDIATFGGDAIPTACGQGGHYVFRYNLITNSSTVNIDGLDLHGNNYYYGNEPGFTNTRQPRWRGSIWLECYSNTFNLSSHSFRAMSLRGGTCMVFGNQYNGTADSCAMWLWEEEAWLSSNFNPLRTVWPAQDQITNSFFWNNTWNGTATNDVRIYQPGVSAVFLQEGRDYWRRAPEATDVLGSYVPLVYPHPLVTAQPTFNPVSPPGPLRVLRP